jgi:hypothetical protein
MAGYQTGNEITADWNGPKMVVGKTNFAAWWPQEVLSQLESQSLHTLSVVELPLPAVIPCAKQQKYKEKKKEKKQKKAALALHHRCQDLYTERVCHCLHSHVLVVCVAIALCMLCAFCRLWGGCHTPAYTKQPVFNLTATYTQREFVIDCIIMFQLYVLPLCFVCFVCVAVRGVIAPRQLIQNNQ